MSETGATAREVMRAEFIAAMEEYLGAEWSQQLEPRHFAGLVASYVESELWNKGYQIVPTGAVVLTADEAATASYACSIAADAAYEPVEQDEYRALAAKLGGAS